MRNRYYVTSDERDYGMTATYYIVDSWTERRVRTYRTEDFSMWTELAKLNEEARNNEED